MPVAQATTYGQPWMMVQGCFVTGAVVATATPAGCAITFSDVPVGATFYSYVQCLACKGIIRGYTQGTFRPGNKVTRGHTAKIVAITFFRSATVASGSLVLGIAIMLKEL
jgi:hypothetical protein